MLYIDSQWFASVFNFDARTIAPQTARLSDVGIREKNRIFSVFADMNDPLKAESDTIFFIGNLLFDLFDVGQPAPPRLASEASIIRIKTFIDRHFAETIRLDDLSAISDRSKFSTLRKFKSVYKLSPHAYQLNHKINHAKQLLLDGETVAQTAAACGFFDQSHFIKTFRRYVGMKPIDYK